MTSKISGSFSPIPADDQQISIQGNSLILEDGGTVDLSAFLDNTDDQQIGLSGNILTLEDGGTVDLSVFLDDTDTDEQTITAFNLSPAGILTLAIEDGNTVTVDLSGLDTDTDDQTLSIAGNLLTIADGNTVDLSGINTDDQMITAFNLSPAGILTLTIEDGNTVTADLSALFDDTDTDDQTLSIAGTLLTIADGNTVDLQAFLDDTDISGVDVAFSGSTLTVGVTEDGVTFSDSVDLSSLLDNTDAQTLTPTVVNGETTEISISGGNTIPILHPPTPSLSVTTQTIHEAFYSGGSENGLQSGAWSRNSTITQIGTGRWNVAFSAPHPDGGNYDISFGQGESATLRDVPKVSWESGSKTANGFRVQITVDDNGAGADAYDNDSWSYTVTKPTTVVTGVILN